MDKNILQELNMKTRDEALSFLKSLWREHPLPCPLCNGKLEFMHKKAKKSNCDWKCSDCGYVYKTIRILDLLNKL